MTEGIATGSARAHVSLGSNLGDREAHLVAAASALAAHPSIQVDACSCVYETDPVGPGEQRPYLNATMRLETTLSPRALLDVLLDIENQRGRLRDPGQRWGPRTLDLDLLTFAEQRIDEPGLEVPHPRMAERGFVLEPLCDLAADEVHPVLGESYAVLARAVRVPGEVRRWSRSLPPFEDAGEETWRSSP